MKKNFLLLTLLCFASSSAFAGFSFDKDFFKSAAKQLLDGGGNTQPSESEMGSGLKEALIKGIELGAQKAGRTDGYLKNQVIKILLPPEAQKAEQMVRKLGMGSLADQALTSMNRAAEDAAVSSIPIFSNAIRQLTFTDVLQILKGSDNAATQYLKSKTTTQLIQQFKPHIGNSLGKVDATKYWGSFASTYNKIPFAKKMDVDLSQYVTNKAVDGLFVMISEEELKIRKDPLARSTDLLKKVFGFAASKK